MAILLPFIFRYRNEPNALGEYTTTALPLLVNPTDITIRKHAEFAQVRTMGGTVFQPWPNVPDQVSIKGILYGTRSIVDFYTFRKIMDQRPDLKEVDLIYKWKTYSGYVSDMTISAAADKPRQFNYEMTFLSKEPFDLPRMMLGQLTGYKTEVDYLRNELYGLANNIKADPITGAVTAASAAYFMGASTTGLGNSVRGLGKFAYASVQKIITGGKPDIGTTKKI